MRKQNWSRAKNRSQPGTQRGNKNARNQSSGLLKALYTILPGKLVQSNAISASLGEIQDYFNDVCTLVCTHSKLTLKTSIQMFCITLDQLILLDDEQGVTLCVGFPFHPTATSLLLLVVMTIESNKYSIYHN